MAKESSTASTRMGQISDATNSAVRNPVPATRSRTKSNEEIDEEKPEVSFGKSCGQKVQEKSVRSVKRRLWEKTESDEETLSGKEELRRIYKEDAVKKKATWNFDFEKNKPLDGSWQWSKTDNAPSVYKSKDCPPKKRALRDRITPSLSEGQGASTSKTISQESIALRLRSRQEKDSILSTAEKRNLKVSDGNGVINTKVQNQPKPESKSPVTINTSTAINKPSCSKSKPLSVDTPCAKECANNTRTKVLDTELRSTAKVKNKTRTSPRKRPLSPVNKDMLKCRRL